MQAGTAVMEKVESVTIEPTSQLKPLLELDDRMP